jgi:hypothetical protein
MIGYTWSKNNPSKWRLATRRCIPEDRTLHNHRCENLKCYMCSDSSKNFWLNSVCPKYSWLRYSVYFLPRCECIWSVERCCFVRTRLATLRIRGRETFKSQAVETAHAVLTWLFCKQVWLHFNRWNAENRWALRSFVSRVCGNVGFCRGSVRCLQRK